LTATAYTVVIVS